MQRFAPLAPSSNKELSTIFLSLNSAAAYLCPFVSKVDGLLPVGPGSQSRGVNTAERGPEGRRKYWYTPWNHFVTAGYAELPEHNTIAGRWLRVLGRGSRDAIKKANVINFLWERPLLGDCQRGRAKGMWHGNYSSSWGLMRLVTLRKSLGDGDSDRSALI